MRSIMKSAPSIANMAMYGAAFIIAIRLKQHYSAASPDDLFWILGPVSWIVETLTGIEFVREIGTGYISRDTMTIIAVSCAGVNFLIMAFTLCVFVLIPKARGFFRKTATLLLCAAFSYGAGLMVNSARIIGAMYLYSLDLTFIPATPEQLHRIEGVAVYFTALWGLYALMKKGFRIPFIWYTGFALGVPLLNALRNGLRDGFAEHAVFVSVVPLLMFVLASGWKTLFAFAGKNRD